ncbi:hypothetical protein CNY89_15880 [Amaricoccus sp. HAR-UPW-R2A-40]|nr:hypothetical protein CNY89_15880 [Amaricoccus sp. HAR-UPW-R2A-40]
MYAAVCHRMNGPESALEKGTSLGFLRMLHAAPTIPDASPGGRSRKADKRESVEEILYFLRAGCAWRLSPHDVPP